MERLAKITMSEWMGANGAQRVISSAGEQRNENFSLKNITHHGWAMKKILVSRSS